MRFRWLPLLLVLLLPAPRALAKSHDANARKTAPSFTLPTRSGTPVCSDSLRGKVVLVDFWASWCGPCRKSFPWLKTMHDRYSGKAFRIVAVNLDKDRHLANSFLEKYSAPFTVAFDPSGNSAKAFGVWGMPSGFVVGPTGTILYSYVGFNPKESGRIEAKIEEALPR